MFVSLILIREGATTQLIRKRFLQEKSTLSELEANVPRIAHFVVSLKVRIARLGVTGNSLRRDMFTETPNGGIWVANAEIKSHGILITETMRGSVPESPASHG